MTKNWHGYEKSCTNWAKIWYIFYTCPNNVLPLIKLLIEHSIIFFGRCSLDTVRGVYKSREREILKKKKLINVLKRYIWWGNFDFDFVCTLGFLLN